MCLYAAAERVWVYTLNFWCLNPAVVSAWVWECVGGGGAVHFLQKEIVSCLINYIDLTSLNGHNFNSVGPITLIL